MAGKKNARKRTSSARKSTSSARSRARSGNGSAAAATTLEPGEDAQGVDLTKNPPPGHIVLGDGSPENPNRVVPAQNWHGQTHTG